MMIIILLLLLGLFFLLWKQEKDYPTTPLFELEEYKDIKAEEIKMINIYHYTEGGVESTILNSEKEIKNTIKQLSKIKVGKETTMACDDNTTSYVLEREEDTITIEIECNVLVLPDHRYEIKDR